MGFICKSVVGRFGCSYIVLSIILWLFIIFADLAMVCYFRWLVLLLLACGLLTRLPRNNNRNRWSGGVITRNWRAQLSARSRSNSRLRFQFHCKHKHKRPKVQSSCYLPPSQANKSDSRLYSWYNNSDTNALLLLPFGHTAQPPHNLIAVTKCSGRTPPPPNLQRVHIESSSKLNDWLTDYKVSWADHHQMVTAGHSCWS